MMPEKMRVDCCAMASPTSRLNKAIIDRKLDILTKEGIKFVFNTMLVPDAKSDAVTIQNDPLLDADKKVTAEQTPVERL